ncbi:hypothetical protein CEXT_98361 [Caerostris extrusa]|uniref:Uncharacterized protein n=1 Tax=Caerostris extrusa TaxID=172846 RepID=A0AAV4RL44_CAEEX|nr:hypothetical protein CEXT_98361 [Caerostris extrusa]
MRYQTTMATYLVMDPHFHYSQRFLSFPGVLLFILHEIVSQTSRIRIHRIRANIIKTIHSQKANNPISSHPQTLSALLKLVTQTHTLSKFDSKFLNKRSSIKECNHTSQGNCLLSLNQTSEFDSRNHWKLQVS